MLDAAKYYLRWPSTTFLHNVIVYNLHWKKTTDLSLTIDLHMHILVGSFVDKKLNVSDIAIGHDK
jgi:hypothetical protein